MDKKEGLGGESFFEFKYVPFYNRKTRLGKRKMSKPAKHGVETLAQMGLLAGLVVILALLGGNIVILNLLLSFMNPGTLMP
jgi:hypothetical protein